MACPDISAREPHGHIGPALKWAVLAALLIAVVAGCAADAPRPVRRSAVGAKFDTARVVAIEAVSCTNRLRRGHGVRLADGLHLTASHTVVDTRSIEIITTDGSPGVVVESLAVDERPDLALLLTRPVGDIVAVDMHEWVDVDPSRHASIVTVDGSRDVVVEAEVIVRATRPDGNTREWRGIPAAAAVSPGESGAALVQDGALIGIVVQSERRSSRSLSVASREVREFVSMVVPGRHVAEDNYSPQLQSSGGLTTAFDVAATCP